MQRNESVELQKQTMRERRKEREREGDREGGRKARGKEAIAPMTPERARSISPKLVPPLRSCIFQKKS